MKPSLFTKATTASNLIGPEDGYLCVCGQAFKEPMMRTMHMGQCPIFADHKAGEEILFQFPRDKYGGYMIAAPAVLIALVRAYLKEKQA